MRDHARFADGEPVIAADVVFTFETAMTSAGLVDLTMVERVEVRGPHEVRITLKRPWIAFTRQLTTLGSGPFRFVGWHLGQQLVVAPNPHGLAAKFPSSG